jgi:hypothetical protein
MSGAGRKLGCAPLGLGAPFAGGELLDEAA